MLAHIFLRKPFAIMFFIIAADLQHDYKMYGNEDVTKN